MTDDQAFGIRQERTSWKSIDLIYEEPGHQLVVYLEMSGVPEFDWVGVDTAFQAWTAPADKLIPDGKRAEILERVADWSKQKRLRINFGPPIDLEAHLEELRQAGWSVERQEDGTVRATPPPQSLWRRLLNLFTGAPLPPE
jgi:hypothetical protein